MKLLLSALLLALPLTASAGETFSGVGMVLKQTEGHIFVESVIEGAPVSRDGTIQAGDEVVSVQQTESTDPTWVPVADMPLEDAIHLIRGEAGTRVGLSMANSRTGQFQVVITREVIEMP